jgi:hypothetical protein
METRRRGDVGDVRAVTGEWELRIVPGIDAEAEGERAGGWAIVVLAGPTCKRLTIVNKEREVKVGLKVSEGV